MNREDIICMAKECGAYPAANVDGALLFWSESQVERFAALVASAEREACAKVCEDVRDKYSSLEDPAERIAVEWCLDLIRDRGQA